MLALLFKAVSKTLLEFGQTRLKGSIGITAVLHTWDQTLKDHFHLHCLVPAGALSFDHSRWIPARENFLFPVKALSRVFRGKFLTLFLQQAGERGKLPAAEKGETKALRQNELDRLREKAFRLATKLSSITSAATLIVWLCPMTASSEVENAEVTLSYQKIQKMGIKKRPSLLDAQEFIRRFLLHVLPEGFMRIRHFGFLANRSKKQALAQCRKLLKLAPAVPQSPILSAKKLAAKNHRHRSFSLPVLS